MRININITKEEYEYLYITADSHGTTVNGLLSQFIADLTASDRSGGSDERCLASEWLSRSIYNLPKK